MRIISATVGPLATANAAIIAGSQSGTAKTKLTLTSSPYTLDVPRRIIITSTQTETGCTFAVVGTDWNGTTASETISGVSAVAVQSVYDYATIISITPSINTIGNITVGTNGVASTRPIFLDEWAFAQVGIQQDVTGTVNTTLQQSFDNPNEITGGYPSVTWFNSTDAATTATTLSYVTNFAYAPKIVHLLLNSGTGSATIRVAQYGNNPF